MPHLICPKCKYQSEKDEEFCTKCGTMLEVVSSDSTSFCKTSGKELKAMDKGDNCSQSQRKKSSKWWWITPCLVFLVFGFRIYLREGLSVVIMAGCFLGLAVLILMIRDDLLGEGDKNDKKKK